MHPTGIADLSILLLSIYTSITQIQNLYVQGCTLLSGKAYF
jgi:hypothetical protein